MCFPRGQKHEETLALRDGSFAVRKSSQSDHLGVQCSLTLTEARQRQRRRRARKVGEPLRVGARPKVGARGVARRPTKHEACAKVEPHTEKNEGGPTYYCGKHHEKPRIRTGDAAILEDPRRKGLWRLYLPRNCAHVNGHLVAEAIVLGANKDAQPVTTAKGVADYACKYITKYRTCCERWAPWRNLCHALAQPVWKHSCCTSCGSTCRGTRSRGRAW